MTADFLDTSDAAFSGSEEPGGAPPSSSGSSPPRTTDAVAEPTLGEKVRAAREAKGMTRTALDNAAGIGNGKTMRIEERGDKIGPAGLGRLADVLEVDLTAGGQSANGSVPPPSVPRELRPSAEGAKPRRRLLGRKPKPGRPSDAAAPRSRPAARRVTTSPLTETALSFAAGGLDRIGQRPLAVAMSFTAPVAGEIVDEVVAGTVVDKLAQPLVRGSEKYQKFGALVALYASVAWASNVPEAEPQAYAMYHWSMTILLPLQGKEMVKRAKEQQKLVEQWKEVEPEMVEMFGPDPIRGLWQTMWTAPPAPAEPTEETAPV